jgi:hypothetical protein
VLPDVGGTWADGSRLGDDVAGGLDFGSVKEPPSVSELGILWTVEPKYLCMLVSSLATNIVSGLLERHQNPYQQVRPLKHEGSELKHDEIRHASITQQPPEY